MRRSSWRLSTFVAMTLIKSVYFHIEIHSLIKSIENHTNIEQSVTQELASQIINVEQN